LNDGGLENKNPPTNAKKPPFIFNFKNTTLLENENNLLQVTI